MIHLISRTLVGLLFGALAAVAALGAVYARHPAIVLEMDRDADIVTGLYGSERLGAETWAWTARDAVLTLPGIDRSVAWSCTVRLRGGRSDTATLPDIFLSVDGVIIARAQTTNEYRDFSVVLPPHASGANTTITLTSSNTVEPGPADRRALGVMVDRWTCAPMDNAFVMPPARALAAAAGCGAVFGAALGLIGLGFLGTLAGAAAIGAGQALPLAWPVGTYSAYVERVPWLALGIAVVLVAAARGTEWKNGRPLHPAARFAGILTAAVLYLKLLALLHPSKAPIDVVFHAHRLMWVLDGRLYFTQPMPSGVRFPYAIGLYLFAAPWTLLTSDYVLLLRIVVSAAEAAGGLLLYLLVSRVWNDRLAGALAVVLFSVLPRTFEIVGNANMTNAFGQSVALATIAAAVLWRLGRGEWWQLAGFTALTAFAFLCHISTFTLLGAILLILAVLYWWRGNPGLRTSAAAIAIAAIVAAIFSVVVYYGHFGEAFRSAAKVRDAAATTASPAGISQGLLEKGLEAMRLNVAAVGWPMLLLGALGSIAWWRKGLHDRLSLAVAAWMITDVAFVASVVAAPVGASFVRYAAEFMTRVTLATSPAIVVLAALGSASALRRGWVWRLPTIALVAAACYTGAQLWLDWLR